jgi:hypothetical protein
VNRNKGQFITEVEALKKAKKFFSRGYNQFNCPSPKSIKPGRYPKGLCGYIRDLCDKRYISYDLFQKLRTDVRIAVDEIHVEHEKKLKKEYRYNYFPTNADRLKYLNSTIKKLDK